MRIAIFGAGGVGGTFGARLARAGEDVVFIARGDHLEAIRRHGLTVESGAGDVLLRPARASDDPASLGRADGVVVAVKTWQLPEAVSQLAPLVGDDTWILPLLNGVEAAAILEEAFGPDRVLGGLARIVSYIAAPGRIRHVGTAAQVVLGERDGRRSERTERLRAAFAKAGIDVEVSSDVRTALWEKFLLVVSWGGIGAVTRAPVGVVRGLPETRALLERAMGEIRRLGRVRGVDLADDAPAKAFRFIDGLPGNATTSLQRDLAAGQRSELDAWNGAVVRLGAAAGVETPLHAFVYNSLLPQELRARGQLAFES